MIWQAKAMVTLDGGVLRNGSSWMPSLKNAMECRIMGKKLYAMMWQLLCLMCVDCPNGHIKVPPIIVLPCHWETKGQGSYFLHFLVLLIPGVGSWLCSFHN